MNKKYVVFIAINGKSNTSYFNTLKDALDLYDSYYKKYAKDNFKDNKFIYLELSIEQGEGLGIKYSVMKKTIIGVEYIVVSDGKRKTFNNLKVAEKFFEVLVKSNLFNSLELILFRNNGKEINKYEVLKSI